MDFDEMKSFLFFMWVLIGSVEANVVLIGKNVSLSFDDTEANFAPGIEGSGERGVLYIAEPLDACTPLKNKNINRSDNAFALIIRGGCTFDDKVRIAQEAGFHAAIVYNNEDNGPLVSMAGSSAGIHMHAVFISKASGKTLEKYTDRPDLELWIIPNIEFSAWSIMAVSFISLIALCAILATCFFVRGQQTRRLPPRNSTQEFHGMSRRLVKAMPSLIFTSALEDNSTSTACAVCLEDYNVGEKLRVLPCHHKFHACCVDSWLTVWRTFCPVCKQDANKSTGNPPPSECTPLLSSAASTPLSSFHSAIPTSSVIQIPPSPIQNYRTPLHSPLTNSALRSHGIRTSRSSADLQNAYLSQRLYASSSLGLPRSSPINSRFMLVSNQCNASSTSYVTGSSSSRAFLLHCTESGASLSAMDSTHSLPES